MITKYDLELIKGFTYSRYELKEYVLLLKVKKENIERYIYVIFMDNSRFHSMDFCMNTKEEFINDVDEDDIEIDTNISNQYKHRYENISSCISTKQVVHLIGINLTFLLEHLNQLNIFKSAS